MVARSCLRVSAHVLVVFSLAVSAAQRSSAAPLQDARNCAAFASPGPALLSRGRSAAAGLCLTPPALAGGVTLRGPREGHVGLQMAKKKGDGGIEESASLPDAAIVDWKGLTMMGAEWVRYGPDEEREGVGSDEPLDPASLPPARWYIVQCNPGLEDAVMATLHAKRQNSKRLQQTLVEVLVPTTPVTRLGVGNRPVVRMEKMMPGYVYVHMHMDKDTWYIIKNSNHVQNFVGHDHARKNAGGGIAAGRGHVVPTPLTRAEERRIFDRIAKEGAVNSGSAEVDQSGLRFKVGSIIQVVSGQLMGNQGKVIEFDHDRNRYKVRLDIFKSELPSELSPDELIQVDGLGGPVLDPESVAFEAAAKARLAAAIDTGSKANPWLKEDEQQ